jgi:protein-tyrosine phosphatase
MTDDRHLDWQGADNARDLGGLRTSDGRETRRGAVVRADAPDQLTAAGWAAVEAHGIRTIVDLRNDDELRPDLAPRPGGLTTLHLPLDGIEDREFWDHWKLQAPPLYYGPFLERFPERAAGVLGAIASARPGGVLVHCVGGRDRTGLITLLLLALAGVAPEEIAADHGLSDERMAAVYTSRGIEADTDLEPLLAAEGTSAREAVAAIAAIGVEGRMRAAGLGDDELAALRARLVTPWH